MAERARVAIVTGGAGSIGRETCRLLSQAGFHCVAADLDGPDALPENAVFQHLDVSDPKSVKSCVAAACAIGDLCLLVNAHGIVMETPFPEYDASVLQRIFAINLEGVAQLCAAASPHIVDRGAIVNFSSVTASMGRTRSAFAYQATKAGVEAMTRCFAIELAPREVRVNCIQPGYLSEPMRGTGAAARKRQGGNTALEALTPFGRLITPAEVAEVAAFLCSDRASGISGVVVPVDGGQRAW